MFEVPKRRRYTWVAPGNTKRYQIDYILTKSRFKKQIITNHSLPGAEIDSDHNLIMAKYRIIRKRITRRPKRKIWDVEKLKNEDSRLDFQNRVHNEVITASTDLSWEELANNIRQSAVKSIGFWKFNPRKS